MHSLLHASMSDRWVDELTGSRCGVGRAVGESADVLRSKRLTRQVTIPGSAGLLTDTEQYFEALTAYRSGDTQPIVERFAEASFDSIVNGRLLVTELTAIRAEWSDPIASRRQAIVWRALDIVFQHPVLDNTLVQRELGVSATGAEASITEFVEIGALKEITGGRDTRRYAAVPVLAALDASPSAPGVEPHERSSRQSRGPWLIALRLISMS